MEAVTLGGLAIVIFGLWVEFETQCNLVVRLAFKALRIFSWSPNSPLGNPSYQRIS
jgi:hypothetical protein